MGPEAATRHLDLDLHPYTKPVGDPSTFDGRKGQLGTRIFSFRELPSYTQDAYEKFGLTFEDSQFGSSTISSFRLDAPTQQAKMLRSYLDVLTHLGESAREKFLKRQYYLARKRVGRFLKMNDNEAQRRIFFGHSGTHLIQMLRMGLPDAEVVLINESGTTMQDAYEGRNLGKVDLHGKETLPKSHIINRAFGKVHPISIRQGTHGASVPFANVEASIIETIAKCKSDQVIVHLSYPSKTAYSQRELLALARTLKDGQKMRELTKLNSLPNIVIVLDMAQTRSNWDNNFNDPVAMGLCDIALWTGSKSLLGNGFSGVASVSDRVVTMIHEQEYDPRRKWHFEAFAKKFVRGGYLPEMTHRILLRDPFKYDGALLGRMISTIPTIKRLKDQETIRNYNRNTIQVAGFWNSLIKRLRKTYPGFKYLNRTDGASSVQTFELGDVNIKKLRALLMHPFDPLTINHFSSLDLRLLDILAIPFEICNPVAETISRPSKADQFNIHNPSRHQGLGRVAFSTEMILDWSDVNQRNHLKKVMILLGIKMAWICENYSELSKKVFEDPKNGLYVVSD